MEPVILSCAELSTREINAALGVSDVELYGATRS